MAFQVQKSLDPVEEAPVHGVGPNGPQPTQRLDVDGDSLHVEEREKTSVGGHSTTGVTSGLKRAPVEIIYHILSFLENEPPSEQNFNQQPGPGLTQSDEKPLKSLSLVSKKFRSISLRHLFTHAKLDPYHLSPFLSFLRNNRLMHCVRSAVAVLQGPCNHLHPAWWARLLSDLPITTFTILCAPHVFAELVFSNIVGVDSWAFNMPFQIMRFRQSEASAASRISLNHIPQLFSASAWTDFSVNEGSHLKAYTTYEYFFRRPPSVLAALHDARSIEADNMFANLKVFTFTAIFPFYNHVDKILKSVQKMKNLRTLRTKLCPEPESTVLTDEIAEATGHIDVNDPWNEFDTSYALIAHTVRYLAVEGQLKELVVDDMKMIGIKDNIETSITQRIQAFWTYSGSGVWRKIE